MYNVCTYVIGFEYSHFQIYLLLRSMISATAERYSI